MVLGLILLSGAFVSLSVIMAVFGEPIPAELIVQNSPIHWQMNNEAASAVLGIFLFIIAVYSSSINSVSCLYVAEIFPGPSRSKGLSVCMCASWIVDAILTLVLPYSFQFLTYWTFLLVGLLNLIGAMVILKFPETRGLSEVQIEAFYDPSLSEKSSNSQFEWVDHDSENLRNVESASSLSTPSHDNKDTLEQGKFQMSPEQPSPISKGTPETYKQNYESGNVFGFEAFDSNVQIKKVSEANLKSSSSSLELEEEKEVEEEEVKIKLKEENGTKRRDKQRMKDFAKRSYEHRELNTGGTSIEEVLDVYTAPDTNESKTLSSPGESFYSNGWFSSGLNGKKSIESSSFPSEASGGTVESESINSDNYSVASAQHKKYAVNKTRKQTFGATNFLNFDTLRVALKNFYTQQKKESQGQTQPILARHRGPPLNANSKSSEFH